MHLVRLCVKAPRLCRRRRHEFTYKRRVIPLVTRLNLTPRIRSYTTSNSNDPLLVEPDWRRIRKQIMELTKAEEYNEACRVFQEVRRTSGLKQAPYVIAAVGVALKTLRDKKIRPSIDACNTLIDLGRMAMEKFDDLFVYVDQIKMIGLRPDVTTFNNLIDVVCEHPDRYMTFAPKIIDMMRLEDVKPDINTMNPMIQMYATSGTDSDGVLHMFTVMKSEGIAPNLRTAAIVDQFFVKRKPDRPISQKIVAKFDDLCDYFSVGFRPPYPKITMPFEENYYAHFPKVKFGEDGIPIIPEEFNLEEDVHAVPEDRKYTWAEQGPVEKARKEADIPKKQNPKIRTLEDVMKAEKTKTLPENPLEYDYENIKKEVFEHPLLAANEWVKEFEEFEMHDIPKAQEEQMFGDLEDVENLQRIANQRRTNPFDKFASKLGKNFEDKHDMKHNHKKDEKKGDKKSEKKNEKKKEEGKKDDKEPSYRKTPETFEEGLGPMGFPKFTKEEDLDKWVEFAATKVSKEEGLPTGFAEQLKKDLKSTFRNSPPGFPSEREVGNMTSGSTNSSRVRSFITVDEIRANQNNPAWRANFKDELEKMHAWRVQEVKRAVGQSSPTAEGFTPEELMSNAEKFAQKAANRPPLDTSDADKTTRTMYEEIGVQAPEFTQQEEEYLMRDVREFMKRAMGGNVTPENVQSEYDRIMNNIKSRRASADHKKKLARKKKKKSN